MHHRHFTRLRLPPEMLLSTRKRCRGLTSCSYSSVSWNVHAPWPVCLLSIHLLTGLATRLTLVPGLSVACSARALRLAGGRLAGWRENPPGSL